MPDEPRPVLRYDPSALLDVVVPDAQVAECVPRTGGQLSMVYEARFADGTDPVIIKVYARRTGA